MSPDESVIELLKRRGPDSLHIAGRTVVIDPNPPSDHLESIEYHLTFASSVLSLRGNRLVTQPLVDDSSGCVLCWNGEAWMLDGSIIQENDAQAVFHLLLRAVQCWEEFSVTHIAYEETLRSIMIVLSSISGPFAFVFYDATFQRIFYGRDVLGRRSLLTTEDHSNGMMISSVCNAGTSPGIWREVEADGLHMHDLKISSSSESTLDPGLSNLKQDYPTSRHFPWTLSAEAANSPIALVNIVSCYLLIVAND